MTKSPFLFLGISAVSSLLASGAVITARLYNGEGTALFHRTAYYVMIVIFGALAVQAVRTLRPYWLDFLKENRGQII